MLRLPSATCETSITAGCRSNGAAWPVPADFEVVLAVQVGGLDEGHAVRQRRGQAHQVRREQLVVAHLPLTRRDVKFQICS